MRHRGPDRRRTRVTGDRRIGLGHARLAIVDLSEDGDQPMGNETDTLWMVCNGEVYNHVPLRAELEARGHQFRSRSDCEVLLHGYEEWGLDVLERVRGMFALVLCDVIAGRAIAARDRFGEKPLVYCEDGEGVLVGSEIPPLRLTGRIGDDVDLGAVLLSLSRNLRHVPDPLSVFRDVRKVPPAHALIVEHGRVAGVERWWRPTWGGPRTRSADLRRAVEEAVSMQRQADVEVGALLSGGVDSSIVVGLAARDGSSLRTYALGRSRNDPELARARRASVRFGTRHREALFEAAQLARLDQLIAQLGEPIALLPLTHADALMRRVAEDGLKVVLTGNGADEILYGYPGVSRVRMASLAMSALERLPGIGRRALGAVRLPGEARQVLELAALPNSARKTSLYADHLRELAQLLHPRVRQDAVAEADQVFSGWADAYDGRNYIDLSQFLTLMVEDAHSVTIIGDVVGMNHSIETRAPFLDRDVVQTSFRLPVREKAGGLLRPNGKRALKDAFENLIGRDVVRESKMGFGFALQESELIRGQFRGAVERRLLEGEGIARFFDRSAVRRVVDDHMRGACDRGKLILGLYAFEAWHASAFGAEGR